MQCTGDQGDAGSSGSQGGTLQNSSSGSLGCDGSLEDHGNSIGTWSQGVDKDSGSRQGSAMGTGQIGIVGSASVAVIKEVRVTGTQ